MINSQLKFKMFFLFFLVISSTIMGFEVKTGYFFFSDSKMRKVYDRGGLDIQLCDSYPLWNLTRRWNLSAYGAVEYFHRFGKSIHGGQKTSLWSIPINFGLKPTYTIDTGMEYYFSVGPRYFYLHQHNLSSDIYKNKSGHGLGFFINTGLNYLLCDLFTLDIFGEYSSANAHLHSRSSHTYTRNIQVGGFAFGVGAGCEF